MESYHSSLLAKTGSTSKTTPRKSKMLVTDDVADGEAGKGHVDFLSHAGGTLERFKRGHGLLSRQRRGSLLERRVRPEPALARPALILMRRGG